MNCRECENVICKQKHTRKLVLLRIKILKLFFKKFNIVVFLICVSHHRNLLLLQSFPSVILSSFSVQNFIHSFLKNTFEGELKLLCVTKQRKFHFMTGFEGGTCFGDEAKKFLETILYSVNIIKWG